MSLLHLQGVARDDVSGNQVLAATKQFVAGAFGGVVAKTVIAPFDRVKIIFQVSQEPFTFRAALFRFIEIVKTEGPLALFKGNGATAVRVIPYSGVQLMSFDQLSRVCLQARGKTRIEQLTGTENMVVGALAGGTSVVCTYPLDVIRARLAVQRQYHKYNGVTDAFTTLLKEEGVVAMYRGMFPALLGILPYAGLAFYTFQTLKKVVVRFTGEEPAAWQRLLCGGAAGFVGQTVTYPLDVVRRRMQTERFILHQLQGRGWTADPTNSAVNMSQASRVVVEDSGSTIREVWRSVVAKEGWRGLFKGLTLNWIKGPLSVGISLTLFDITKGMLH